MSARSRRGGWRCSRICPRACISSRPSLAGTENPAPMPASPACSRAAGASDPACRGHGRDGDCPDPWPVLGGLGALVDVMTRSTTTRCSRSPASAASDRLQHRRHGRGSGGGDAVGGDQVSPPAAFAISPASRRPIRRCGATSSCTTRMRCWRCSAASARTSRSDAGDPLRRGRDDLHKHFTRTRAIRRSIIAGQDVDAPDFGRPHTLDKKV
jgi:hypothetical protein